MSETVFIGNTLFPYEGIRSGSIEECIEYLSNQHVIGLDIETSRKYPKGMYPEDVYKPGLDPYLSRIVMVQTGTLEKRYIIDARVIDISPLKQILENKSIVKVGHNLKFEGKFFLHTIGARLVNVWDVMISENVLYNGARISYSLEAMMGRYLNIKPVKEVNLFNQIDVSEIDIQLKRGRVLSFRNRDG
jgi:DNA polymerase I-like protein with 3'-5' exonuclease and polymerase domains